MFKLTFRCSFQIFLLGILVSLVPSLLYSAETADTKNNKGNITQVVLLTENLAPTPNSISDIEHMFSKIVFSSNGEEPIEFHSHECVRIAHCLIEGMKVQKKDVIKPLEATSPKIPSYSSYNDQVENEFQRLTRDLISKTAKFYKIDGSSLNYIIEMFYKIGPNAMFYNPGLMELWSNLMTSIKEKKDDSVSFVEETYDKHILPAQINPFPCSIAGWLGLARYIKKANEPITGWWISIGDRLILLKNLPNQRQHFYVSDHGFQKEVLHSTKENFLTFSDQGRKELFYSLSFWKLFYEKLPKEGKKLLKERYLLLLHQGYGGNDQQEEFLLYVLSLPKDLCSRALSDGRLDYPCSNVGHYIGTRYEGDPWGILPLSTEEAEILERIPMERQKEYIRIYNKNLEQINHQGKQGQIYFESLYAGGGLSPFFTQINNIFSPADAGRYQMFFILKEISKGLANGLQEFLFRPLHCFGSREEGGSYRGFANAFDQYVKSETARPSRELAQEMRALLKGGVLKDESLYFLPNLVAAWFISEVARNEGSILSGLMLLDLIESGIPLIDVEGCNRYEWKYTLIHPKKPQYSSTKVSIKDLYGNNIDLADFDGVHPMAHHGSINGSQTLLTNKTNLSTAQQKEGHLVIHWLSEKLKNEPALNIQPHSIKVAGVLPKNPNYTEIDRLLQAIHKPSTRMSPQLKRKWHYLQIIKRSLMERLNTLDQLLGIEGCIKQVPFSLNEISIKRESLKTAEDGGKIGPRTISGWILHDVEDLGNCFYDAIIHQMGITDHSFLKQVPQGTLPRDSLRLRIQGENFKDEEWVEDKQIDEFVTKFDVILAIINTRIPENGYVYYFVGNDGQVITKHPDDDGILLPNKLLLKLAATGSHFLSVIAEKANL